MVDRKTSGTFSCAALLLIGTVFSCSSSHGGSPGDIRCEGLAAVGTGTSGDRVVVAFRNVSGRTINAFKARYEALSGDETLAAIDFVCDRRTVRKLESGDEIPFVFEDGELVFVNYVHFRRDRLPDRFYVTSGEQIQAAIDAGTLLPGRGGERCSILEVEFDDRS